MAIVRNRVVRRIILGFNEDGSFSGGQADYVDVFVDDQTSEVLGRQDTVGEPISGALQPGTPVATVLGETETQRAQALVTEQARADAEKARADLLEEELENVTRTR